MPNQGDDQGLKLRLPWGERSPQLPKPIEDPSPPAPAAVDPPPEPTGTAPPPAAVNPPVGWLVAPAPTVPQLSTEEVQRSLETLLAIIEGRFDRLEERLVQVESRSSAVQPADPAAIEQMSQRAGRAIERRVESLEALVTASHGATMEAVRQLAADGSSAGAVAPDLVARLERLEALLDRTDGRIDQLASRIDASHRALLTALDGLVPRHVFADLAEEIAARGESLDGELTEIRRLLGRSAEIASLNSSTPG